VAALIDQFADSGLPQSRALSKLANVSHNLSSLLFLASVGWNQFSNRNTPPRDPDRLSLGDSFQQAIEMGFSVEDSDGGSVSHTN